MLGISLKKVKPGNIEKISEFEIFLNYRDISLAIPIINRLLYFILFFATAVAVSRNRIVLA